MYLWSRIYYLALEKKEKKKKQVENTGTKIIFTTQITNEGSMISQGRDTSSPPPRVAVDCIIGTSY